MSDNEKKQIELQDKKEITQDHGEPTRPGIQYLPLVDIYETEQAMTVVADLPGVSKEDLDVDLREGVLTLTGLVNAPESRLDSVYTEYGIGGYTRKFALGDSIDQSKIEAVLQDGVLTLTLPKSDRLRPRKISLTAG